MDKPLAFLKEIFPVGDLQAPELPADNSLISRIVDRPTLDFRGGEFYYSGLLTPHFYIQWQKSLQRGATHRRLHSSAMHLAVIEDYISERREECRVVRWKSLQDRFFGQRG